MGSNASGPHCPAGLVVLDIQLPDFDGFEVARRLAADPAAGLAPLVMLAGYLDTAGWLS